MEFETVGTPLLWVGFTVLIASMLALDLGVFHRRAHVVTMREAMVWTVVWIVTALLFNIAVYLSFGSERALEFLTGYVIEKALSIDNIFVFLVIFSSFSVPANLHHRVLFWGILGAMVLRGVFILLGAALLQTFHWVLYIFGALLIYSGVRFLACAGPAVEPERNPLFQFFRRLVPSVADYRNSQFWILDAGKRYATPLLLVLLSIEITDIAFAVDSIPAIFAVTTDPFIVYTSNIFAILGLRALYFVLAGLVGRFRFLDKGLGLVLGFVGLKMMTSDLWEIPIGLSLGIILILLTGSVIASVLLPSLVTSSQPAVSPESRLAGSSVSGRADCKR